MRTSDKGLLEIVQHEGVKLSAYPDPASGGAPWTIGVGHTRGVLPGTTCTYDQAMAWLRQDVVWAENAINRLVHVPLDQNQFDALVDFVFNVGEGQFEHSTLLRLLNNGDYEGADEQFQYWVYASGRVMPGLVARRHDEAITFAEKSDVHVA